MAATKSIILYRYHQGDIHHIERLHILRRLNPNVPIHGLYGGTDFVASQRNLSHLFDSLVAHPSQDTDWKWRMNDLVVRDWYAMIGHRFAFDIVYDHEFDLLFTEPHERVYPAAAHRTLALTHLFALTDMDAHWYWTADPQIRPRLVTFLRYMADTFGMGYPKHGCMWAGAAMPRSFLEEFIALGLDDSKLLVCELTTPCVAEMLGYDLIDNTLMPNLSRHVAAPLISPCFHADSSKPISVADISQELSRGRGRPRRSAFHPVKGVVTWADIQPGGAW